MKIIGVDPGSALMGYGVISCSGESAHCLASGVFKPPSQLSFPEKLLFIHNQLTPLLKTHQPDVAVVEKAFFGKNADSAFRLGQVRGVILSAVAACEASVVEIAAKRVKKLVTGNGAAEKGHVQLIVGQLLNIGNFQSHDESDALAMALAYQREFLAQEVFNRHKEAPL